MIGPPLRSSAINTTQYKDRSSITDHLFSGWNSWFLYKYMYVLLIRPLLF